jgi:hypothetical protein
LLQCSTFIIYVITYAQNEFKLPTLIHFILFFDSFRGFDCPDPEIDIDMNHIVWIKSTKTKIDFFNITFILLFGQKEAIKSKLQNLRKKFLSKKKWCKKILLKWNHLFEPKLKGKLSNIHFIYEQFDLFKYTLISFFK